MKKLLPLSMLLLLFFANQAKAETIQFQAENIYCGDGLCQFSESAATCPADCSYAIASSCADGTPFNRCSASKPYFCIQGVLINAADRCGCPPGTTRANFKCATTGEPQLRILSDQPANPLNVINSKISAFDFKKNAPEVVFTLFIIMVALFAYAVQTQGKQPKS